MNIAILFTVFLSVLHVFGMMQSNNLGMLGRDGDAAVDSTDTENVRENWAILIMQGVPKTLYLFFHVS